MARLWSSGFELNSATANVEWTAASLGFTVLTIPIRSGTYSGRAFSASGTGQWEYAFNAADADANVFIRFYLYIEAAPSGTQQLFGITQSGNTVGARIDLTTGNKLQLRNGAGTQIGSDSAALTEDTFYLIEIHYDSTQGAGADVVEAKIDGTSFASSSAQTLGTVNKIRIGNLSTGSSVTFDVKLDDVAINDTTGSFQNSWPGEGEIIHLRPNNTGDNSDWTNTYTNIDEVTPDDATTIISSATTNQIEDVNIDDTPAALASDDTINVVQVGVRFSEDIAASFDPTFVLRIKASASGTTEESANITANATGYNTNAVAAPRNYRLTLYDLPGASTTAWTKADLDTAQIGVKVTDDTGIPKITRVSTLWLLVDHKPGAGGGGGAAAVGYKNLLGVGI